MNPTLFSLTQRRLVRASYQYLTTPSIRRSFCTEVKVACNPGNRVATRSTGESAFTLVEVLLGVLFVAILFISYFAALNFGALTTRLSREDLRATQILVTHMEGIRLFRW